MLRVNLAVLEPGEPNSTLFTGDAGVALFAAACLDAEARFPLLDGWG